MVLKEFLESFKVGPPYYLRELHNGTGYRYIIYNDTYIKEIKKDSIWMTSPVSQVGVCVHRSLGALLEVTINV